MYKYFLRLYNQFTCDSIYNITGALYIYLAGSTKSTEVNYVTHYKETVGLLLLFIIQYAIMPRKLSFKIILYTSYDCCIK